MTQEEKAKAYDEALERARKLYNDAKANEYKSDMEDYEYIFPELAESEDERIRKRLIEYFEGFRMGNAEVKWEGLNVQEVLVWLEKQKEHQFCTDAPKVKSVGGDFYSSHKDKNLDEIAQEYVDGVKKYNSEPTWDLMQTAVCYGANWQKEQFEKNRLANCDALSKEDCDRETDFAMEIIEKEHRQPTFNDAINYGMRLQKEQKHPNGCFTCDEYKKGYEEGRRNGFTAGYNKAMKEVEQKEQKPVVTHGETYHVDTLGTQQVIAGKMPQKPAEWSQEDEKDMAHIIRILDDCYVYGTHDLSKTDRENLVNKLKSLRPHWKPSEEHLEALLNTLHPDDPYYSDLKSLYEQLKKL